MADILTRRGVADGCAVTAQGTPAATVAVAAGHILYDNQLVAVTAGNVDILTGHPADPTNPRWDYVVSNSSGTLSQMVGTPTAPDQNGVVQGKPTLAGTEVVLAEVYVGAAVTTITSTAIFDRRSDTKADNGYVPQHATANTLIYTFLSTALSNADPGAGKFGFDTTDTRTIAHMYINTGSPSIVDNTGPVNDWLYGGGFPFRLRCWARQDPMNWAELQVTGVTTHTNYTDVALKWIAGRNPLSFGVTLSTDPQDTIIEYIGSFSTITSICGSNNLAADATIAVGSWTDLVSTGSLGASGQLFLLIATVQLQNQSSPAASRNVTCRLWDGTTVLDERQTTLPAALNATDDLTLQTIAGPAGATNYKVSAQSSGANTVAKADAPSFSAGTHVATKLTYVQLA